MTSTVALTRVSPPSTFPWCPGCRVSERLFASRSNLFVRAYMVVLQQIGCPFEQLGLAFSWRNSRLLAYLKLPTTCPIKAKIALTSIAEVYTCIGPFHRCAIPDYTALLIQVGVKKVDGVKFGESSRSDIAVRFDRSPKQSGMGTQLVIICGSLVNKALD